MEFFEDRSCLYKSISTHFCIPVYDPVYVYIWYNKCVEMHYENIDHMAAGMARPGLARWQCNAMVQIIIKGKSSY